MLRLEHGDVSRELSTPWGAGAGVWRRASAGDRLRVGILATRGLLLAAALVAVLLDML